jgi:hypothetical protein
MVLSASGIDQDVPLSDKRLVARAVIDAVLSHRAQTSTQETQT